MSEEKLFHEERKEISRITFKSLFLDLIDLSDIDKGYLFTIIIWSKNPAKGIAAYLGEKRYVMSNPFRMATVLLAISVFFISQGNFFDEFVSGFASGVNNAELESDAELNTALNDMMVFMYEYFNIITFCSIPIIAAVTRLFYLKRDFNYAEHLVINTFIINIQTLIFIFSIGLYLITKFEPILFFYFVPTLFYQAYAYASIFKSGTLRRVTVALFTTFFQYFIIFLLTIVGITLFLLNVGVAG